MAEPTITINHELMEARKDGETIPLTPQDYKLLVYLKAHSRQVLQKEQILTDVWGYADTTDVRAVRMAIHRLRQKIEDDPTNPKLILTRRGYGIYCRL